MLGHEASERGRISRGWLKGAPQWARPRGLTQDRGIDADRRAMAMGTPGRAPIAHGVRRPDVSPASGRRRDVR